jgi:hypothetical protein
MKTTLQRKEYSPTEKDKIALEVQHWGVLKGEMTQSEITSKYGVHGTQIKVKKPLHFLPPLINYLTPCSIRIHYFYNIQYCHRALEI